MATTPQTDAKVKDTEKLVPNPSATQSSTQPILPSTQPATQPAATQPTTRSVTQPTAPVTRPRLTGPLPGPAVIDLGSVDLRAAGYVQEEWFLAGRARSYRMPGRPAPHGRWSVIVAGKVRKWKGRLLDINLSRLRRQLEDSRDYVFAAAGIPQDLFRPN